MSPKRRDARPRPVALGEILGELSGRRRWAQRLTDAAIVDRWEDIAGAAVAARSRVVRLAGGVLVVAVDDPAWATQLRFLERELVTRAAEVLGADRVRTVHFVVEGRAGPATRP